MSNQIRASSSLIRRLKQQMSNPAVLIQTRSFTPSEGQRPVIVHKRSLDILHDPWFNKVCSLMTFNFFSILWSLVILFVVCYSFVLFNLSPKKKKKRVAESWDFCVCWDWYWGLFYYWVVECVSDCFTFKKIIREQRFPWQNVIALIFEDCSLPMLCLLINKLNASVSFSVFSFPILLTFLSNIAQRAV